MKAFLRSAMRGILGWMLLLSAPAWFTRFAEGLWMSQGFAIAGGADNLIQFQKASKLMLAGLYNELEYANNFNTEYKDDWNDRHGPQIQIPKPMRFVPGQGDAIQVQGMTEPSVLATVQPPINIGMAPTMDELQLILGDKLSEWWDRAGDRAASNLASEFDRRVGLAQLGAYNLVGTPGSPPGTGATTAIQGVAAGMLPQRRLNEEACPRKGRFAILSEAGEAVWLPSMAGNNFVTSVAEPGQKMATMPPILSWKSAHMSQSTPTRQVGAWNNASTPQVSGPGQSGSLLQTSGWIAAASLNVGDVFHIANVNAVNPQNRISRGVTRQFVVGAPSSNPTAQPGTVACTADAGGNMLIPLGNPLVPPIAGVQQQFQTVDSFPANGAAITVDSGPSGTSFTENVVAYKDAIVIATLRQVLSIASEYCQMMDYKGIGMRVWLGPDIRNNQEILRADISFAIALAYMEMIVRWTN